MIITMIPNIVINTVSLTVLIVLTLLIYHVTIFLVRVARRTAVVVPRLIILRCQICRSTCATIASRSLRVLLLVRYLSTLIIIVRSRRRSIASLIFLLSSLWRLRVLLRALTFGAIAYRQRRLVIALALL